jgi:predicted secreted protein|tara:strand:+ start:102 stop:491 length:390 start_codon:yes stop_codon:yes gene_type:complete
MATHKGSEGTVHVGSNAVAEIRSYSLDETADTVEDTSMGDAARTYIASLTTFSGSIDVFWDETDTNGQVALSVGSSVTLKWYPEGSSSGDTYYSGTALVTGKNISASFDGMVEASISVQGTGAITTATV